MSTVDVETHSKTCEATIFVPVGPGSTPVTTVYERKTVNDPLKAFDCEEFCNAVMTEDPSMVDMFSEGVKEFKELLERTVEGLRLPATFSDRAHFRSTLMSNISTARARGGRQ